MPGVPRLRRQWRRRLNSGIMRPWHDALHQDVDTAQRVGEQPARHAVADMAGPTPTRIPRILHLHTHRWVAESVGTVRADQGAESLAGLERVPPCHIHRPRSNR